MSKEASEKSFTTVIVARDSSDPPSDLEIVLRQWTNKLRVVGKLSGGSHLLLPGKETIAVRAYFPKEIARLDDELKQRRCQQDGENVGSSSKAADNDVDVDRVRNFRDTFKYPIVFFVFPTGGELYPTQLDRPDSFFMTTQRIFHSQRKTNVQQSGRRLFIVPDVLSILRTLRSIIDTIQPEKMERKKLFFERCAAKNGISDAVTGIPTSESVFGDHVKSRFREWAKRTLNVPPGDADVVMSVLGSVGGVISSADDPSFLDNVPVRDSSKRALASFFGVDRSRSPGFDYYAPVNDAERRRSPTDVAAMRDSRVQNTVHESIRFHHRSHRLSSSDVVCRPGSLIPETLPIQTRNHYQSHSLSQQQERDTEHNYHQIGKPASFRNAEQGEITFRRGQNSSCHMVQNHKRKIYYSPYSLRRYYS